MTTRTYNSQAGDGHTGGPAAAVASADQDGPEPATGRLDASTHRALAIAFGSHAHQTSTLAAVLHEFAESEFGVTGMRWRDAGGAAAALTFGSTTGPHAFAYRLHDATGHGHLADVTFLHTQALHEAALMRLEEVVAVATVTLSAQAGHTPAPVTVSHDNLIAIRIDNFDRLLHQGGLAAGQRAADRICEVVGMICGTPSSQEQMRVAADGLLELRVSGDSRAALDLAERVRTVMAAQPLTPGTPPLTVSVLVAMGANSGSRAALRATRNAVVSV